MIDTQIWSSALGGFIDAAVYLPKGYDTGAERYPTIYLLHGRGNDSSDWQQVEEDFDELTASARIPPMIAVAPDAPWSNRASYYVDSTFSGNEEHPAGARVETAFSTDLVAHVDRTYRTIAHRSGRMIAGYSMGGAGALRFVTAHQDVFSAAIVLSAAVYNPLPPSDSTTREYGAYGVGDRLFVEERYRELNYPASLSVLDPSMPIHVFLGVGDNEVPRADPDEAGHELDYETAALYDRARRVAGVTAELRVVGGAHDWSVWRPLFREGLLSVSRHLLRS